MDKNVLYKYDESEVAQSWLPLCDPIDCSLPGSSVHGIIQAIVLEWIAISLSRESFQPRAWTRVSHIVDRCFTVWATREVQIWWRPNHKVSEKHIGMCNSMNQFQDSWAEWKEPDPFSQNKESILMILFV